LADRRDELCIILRIVLSEYVGGASFVCYLLFKSCVLPFNFDFSN